MIVGNGLFCDFRQIITTLLASYKYRMRGDFTLMEMGIILFAHQACDQVFLSFP